MDRYAHRYLGSLISIYGVSGAPVQNGSSKRACNKTHFLSRS